MADQDARPRSCPSCGSDAPGVRLWDEDVDDWCRDGWHAEPPAIPAGGVDITARVNELVTEGVGHPLYRWATGLCRRLAEEEARRQLAEREVEALKAVTAILPDDIDPHLVPVMLRLLGPARMVLDRAAHLLGDGPGLPGAEAADMAQRLVDWIGHPVTGEPAWATMPCQMPAEEDACRMCRPCVSRMVAGYAPGLVDGRPVVDGRAP